MVKHVKCPIVKCNKPIVPKYYYKHVKEYEEEHRDNELLSKSHDRFADYYFHNIFSSDLPEQEKWQRIAEAYIQQEKNSKAMKMRREIKEARPDINGRLFGLR